MRTDLQYLDVQRSGNAKIEGTPYQDAEFRKGALMLEGKRYENLLLRYNYYAGYFEYKEGDQVMYLHPGYAGVDSVWIGDEKYIYLEYQNLQKTKKGYMRMLYDGQTDVLIFREAIVLQPEASTGYEEAKPPRFRLQPEQYFVRLQNKPAMEFNGRKSIPVIFPDHADSLDAFRKREKMKFRTADDLVELCKYYDSLN
ncbi:MAG: hypothetical protein WD052_08505 [Bacteroidales bacterium]